MTYKKHPPWLMRKINPNSNTEISKILDYCQLNTVCEEACCPNIWECFQFKRATFMILGKLCTRRCKFCAVKNGSPNPPDIEEGKRIAEAAQQMGLKHIVVTSVTRDDLPDGGAYVFALTIEKIQKTLPHATVEVLTPDFSGNIEALKVVLDAQPEIFNHNVETVPRLYKQVRPDADYYRSLFLLKKAKELFPTVITKSGLMVGLGEKTEEVFQVAKDLREADCELITIGQYLRPSLNHLPVERYYTPEEFYEIEKKIAPLGFRHVSASPLTRSSYKAEDTFISL